MSPASTQSPVFESRAHGKLLLTGEYFVLDGALALALPVRYGQTLRAEVWSGSARLSWTSKDDEGQIWFLAEYALPELTLLNSNDKKIAATLSSILQACRLQNPHFLADNQGYQVLTQNDFPREWGLGTSSTLIAALAKWAQVNPYPVLFDTMGGSGYDIACSYAESPILYRLQGGIPEVQPVRFDRDFTGSLYFAYLGKKQDSRAGIQRYRERSGRNASLVEDVSRLTERFFAAATLDDLEKVIREHETLISRALDLPCARDLYFSDFWGTVKSLGAWGGDFVLATSNRPDSETRRYFSDKGFDTVLNWKEMTPDSNYDN